MTWWWARRGWSLVILDADTDDSADHWFWPLSKIEVADAAAAANGYRDSVYMRTRDDRPTRRDRPMHSKIGRRQDRDLGTITREEYRESRG